MLKQMTPKRHDDSNGDVCHITMKDWDDGTGPHLDAFPMEGDLWEHSLTKEIVLDADVHVTDAEIIACCLWHTSFYGFTKGQKKEFANIDFKSKVKELKTIILNNGGYVPPKRELLPSKKQEMIGKVITATERKGTVDLILNNNPVLCRQIEITVVATDISIHR